MERTKAKQRKNFQFLKKDTDKSSVELPPVDENTPPFTTFDNPAKRCVYSLGVYVVGDPLDFRGGYVVFEEVLYY